MSLIEKIKDKYFTTMVTLITIGMVKRYGDRLIIIVNGEVIYKGENYEKFKGTGKARSIKSKDNESGEMKTMLINILRRNNLIH